MPLIRAVLFDMIGTTVMEKDPQVVNRCFENAFHEHGIPVTHEVIRANRGKDKQEAIYQILGEHNADLALAQPVLHSFKNHFRNNLGNFQDNSGTDEIFSYLKDKGIYVGIGTGLSRDLFDPIVEHLKWTKYRFDYTGIAEEIGKGRPYPDMILGMIKMFSLNPRSLLKVGDTIADIDEGKNAGVITAAIASGTQPVDELLKHKPDHLIFKLPELKTIVP
jgi:phosphonatase-like hydrolase